MQDIINVKKENGQLLVSARELYLGLGLDRSNWIRWSKKNIVNDEFHEEGIDYTGVRLKDEGNNEYQDYAITLDYAKEIAMMARTSKSKEIRNYFIQCEEQLKQVAIQSPKAFVDSLKLHEYHIEKYLPTFLTWKNVDEVMPLLIKRVGDSVESGEIKLGVLHSVIKVSKQVREQCELSAEKEIMTRYIEDAQAKYDRVLIASKAGTTKANGDLKKVIEDKDKEIKEAKSQRLCDFSDKSLKEIYHHSGVINDLISKEIKRSMASSQRETFGKNLKANVKLIVKYGNLKWEDAYTEVYHEMGLFSYPPCYDSMIDFIWDTEQELDCLNAAVKVRARYGC